MPSAYHRSFMHEEDGDGKYPVPLEKRSQSVKAARQQHELRTLEDARGGSKDESRRGMTEKGKIRRNSQLVVNGRSGYSRLLMHVLAFEESIGESSLSGLPFKTISPFLGDCRNRPINFIKQGRFFNRAVNTNPPFVGPLTCGGTEPKH